MRNRLAIAGIAGLLFALIGGAAAAYAAEFELNPLRLVLSPARSIDAFRLTNPADIPVRVQVSVKAWTQGPDGNDYADSGDIISNPPMFEIVPKGTQTVRVGLHDVKPGEVERSYRAFFQEIPGQNAPAGGIQTLLRISVPIFVPPASPRPAALEFSIVAGATGETIAIHNNGNRHVQITKLTLSGRDGTVLSKAMSLYVLPGRTVSWSPDSGATRLPQSLKITAETDQGPLEGMTDAPHASDPLPR